MVIVINAVVVVVTLGQETSDSVDGVTARAIPLRQSNFFRCR